MRHDANDLQSTLDALVATTMLQTDRGTVADYVPALGHVDPKKFGVAIACTDGRLFSSGDAEVPFSIQSVSKAFTLAMAMGAVGDGLWQRVGNRPSSESFNSIVELEREKGVPRNPFVNAGALVVADILLASHEPREAIGEILRFVRFLAEDDSIVVDKRVARSERQMDYRNAGLANFLAAFKNLRNSPERVLGVYAHHCAISMNCMQLAIAGRFLANAGRNPQSGLQIVSAERSRRINALLLTCGQYDGSGEFAFQVGLPAKSGVGGGYWRLSRPLPRLLYGRLVWTRAGTRSWVALRYAAWPLLRHGRYFVVGKRSDIHVIATTQISCWADCQRLFTTTCVSRVGNCWCNFSN